MISVVLDTNVIVSAILSDRGAPANLLQLWKKGMIDLITCEEILHEVNRVMKTPRLTKLHNLREHEVDKLVALLRNGSKCVDCSYRSEVEIGDPDDRVFLDCAVSGRAQFIITGDHHLLNIREFKKIRIVSPRGFLDFLLDA